MTYLYWAYNAYFKKINHVYYITANSTVLWTEIWINPPVTLQPSYTHNIIIIIIITLINFNTWGTGSASILMVWYDKNFLSIQLPKQAIKSKSVTHLQATIVVNSRKQLWGDHHIQNNTYYQP